MRETDNRRPVTDGGEVDFAFEKVWEHRDIPTADNKRSSELLDDVWVIKNHNGVTALELDTGEERWIYDETDEFSNIHAGGGYAYAVPEDGQELLALDLEDGTVDWQVEHDSSGSIIFPGKPTNEGIFVTGNQGIHAFDHSGEEQLHIDDGDKGAGGFLDVTDEYIVVGGGGPTVYDRADGSEAQNFSESIEAIAVVDDTLVGTDSEGPGLFGYDLKSDDTDWETDIDIDLSSALGSNSFSAGGGYIAIHHSESMDNVVLLVDTETGQLAWERTIDVMGPFTPEVMSEAVVMDVNEGVMAVELETGEQLDLLDKEYMTGMNSALAVESDDSSFYLSSDSAVRRYDV